MPKDSQCVYERVREKERDEEEEKVVRIEDQEEAMLKCQEFECMASCSARCG